MSQSMFALTRSLPAWPSLKQLRKQAKELLKAYRAGDLANVLLSAADRRMARCPRREPKEGMLTVEGDE